MEIGETIMEGLMEMEFPLMRLLQLDQAMMEKDVLTKWK